MTGSGVSATRSRQPPAVGLGGLFWRFVRFGLLAWGGPVAQIGMIRQELVEQERWVSPMRFKRALAACQALPGSEAHGLCVYFGMRVRGRVGALLAGLGFMLPGLLLMLALSWAYVRYGLRWPAVMAAFAGLQIAAAALIAQAVHRLGAAALRSGFLWVIALTSAAAALAALPFAMVLVIGGLAYFLHRQRRAGSALAVLAFMLGTALALLATADPTQHALEPASGVPTELAILWSGLRTGLLTFGGAYTAIPLLQPDAVAAGWLTEEQFLDGVALAGVLPAPLTVFATFVGYVSGGLPGALLITFGVVAPAFCFPLIGHDRFERWIEDPRLHDLLDGVMAAVVGLIAGAFMQLFLAAVPDLSALAVFSAALAALSTSRSRGAVPAVLAVAALCGLALYG